MSSLEHLFIGNLKTLMKEFNMSMIINISKDFSSIPGARYPEEGDFSGQDFRTRILYPKLDEAIKNNTSLTVILDGTAGLGTSFLEESFGGLIRENKLKYDDIIKTLVIISNEDPCYIDEIMDYLNDAKNQG